MALEGKDKIKDLFSSKLQNFEPEVPASFWAGMDQSLPQQPASSPSISPSSSSKIFWMKPLAAVASAVIITVSGIFVYDNYNEKESEIQKITIEEKLSDPDQLKAIPETLLVEAKEMEHKTSYTRASADRVVSLPVEVRRTSVTKVDTVEVSEKKISKSTESHKLGIKQDDTAKEIFSPIKPRKGFTLGASSNMAMNSAERSQQGGILTFASADDLDHIISENNMNDYKMEHDQPISFGLSVSKELSSNLSIETGIVYTYMSSTIKSDNDYLFREKQNFHYLGIPISLNYTFLKYRKLNVYISGGGMIQKDIKGKYQGYIDHVYEGEGFGSSNSKRILSNKKNISQSNPQFSTHLNLGLSYPVYKKLYLYGTIGGVYYFDSSNKYRTIYSDKQIQLNLDLGLKWNF